MKQRNAAVVAVVAVAVVLCAGFTYIAYPDRDDRPFGSPWVDTNCEGNLMSERPSPADDLYAWANYDWLSSTSIPEGEDEMSFLTGMQDASDAELSETISSGVPTVEGELTKALWDMVLDTDARDAAGVGPAKGYMDLIASADSPDELTYALVGTCLPDLIYETQWKHDEDRDTAVCVIPKAIADDPSVYGTVSEAEFVEDLGDLLEAYGYEAGFADSVASEAVRVDSKLADAVAGGYVVRGGDGAFPLRIMLEASGLPAGDAYRADETWIAMLDDMMVNDTRSLVCLALAAFAVDAAPFLNGEVWDAYSDLMAVVGVDVGGYGSEESALWACETVIPTATAGLYSDFIVTETARDRIGDLVGSSVAAYRGMLLSCGWLDGPTLEGALEKLDRLSLNVAESTWGRDFSSLGTGYGTLFDRASAYRGFTASLVCGESGMPMDMTREMAFSIWTANAAYYPTFNGVMVYGPFLQDPMYDPAMTDGEMMAGIGFVVCHEISHAFDPDGGLFDADGNMRDWWTPESRAEYDGHVQAIADYFSGIEVLPGVHADGDLVLGEAVADLCSMQCLMHIASGIDGFDHAAFFADMAGIWHRMFSYEEMEHRVETDVHPLIYLRINVTAQQFQEFHDAFGVTEGDGMWLAPEDRLRVW